jgi:penicillin-binding protein 1A
VLIRKVVDRDGTVLEEAKSEPQPVISPAIAYVLTRLLEDVVKEGTAHGAAVLGRPLAAKTGTTSDGKDAWFAGFTPDLVAVTWLGFDDHRTLGRGETGGHTALPAFLAFMRAAVEGVPARDFALPDGVELADIDPATGLLAPEDQSSQETAFVAGTAPQVRALAPGMAPSDAPAQLFMGEPGASP